MVVVSKKSGQPRCTVDYQRLNASCLLDTHHTPAPFDMVSGVPKHTFKTVADAFRYRRTPMGHCSAGDVYTRRLDDAIQDIQRKYKWVDDTLLYDDSIEGAFWHAYDFLETCSAKGVTL
ncbi:uncharacterized protein [Palaemon carinicauda]|uniref:uncharacterized protein n=1 Tax=Palaemon carinicauda TaxID=392227 RepID=UPI0035B641A0